MKTINKELLEKIFTKKTQDYSFSILFFLILSIFVVFAIRPSLTTAFSLTKEENDLKTLDDQYEMQIGNIINLQSTIEENRDKLYLVEESISNSPQVNKIIMDIKKVGDSNSIIITSLSIGEVNLTELDNKSLQTLKISLEGSGNYENIMAFIKTLFNKRRLETIEKMKIIKDEENTSNSTLTIKMDIQGYYE